MNNDFHERFKHIDVPPVPDLAKGTSVPLPKGKLETELKDAKDKEIRKEGYRHNWRVAVFSSVFGAIAGFIASLIFWFIECRFLS